jgi:hypothetical protein
VRVAGVRVAQLARRPVDHAVEGGDEHLGRRQLVAERVEQVVDRARRVARRLRVNGRRAHGQRHDERRAVAMARHVADHHAGARRTEPEEMIEVAADAFRGQHARRHLRFRRDDRRARQQPHLEVVRELHLLRELLLRERLPHQPRVLDGGADLRRDGRDELLVAGAELLARAAIRQIDDAERLAAVGCGPHDRHGEHAAASIGALAVVFLLARVDDDRVLRAEHARRHAPRIADGDPRRLLQRRAEHRDRVQRVGWFVVHEDRRAPRAHRLRDLDQDGRGGLLQRHGAAEDLADRVEEVDLLVALGQLVRGVLHLERRLEVLRDDGRQELQVGLERAGLRAWSHQEPRAARAGDAGDELRPARVVVPRRGPAWGKRVECRRRRVPRHRRGAHERLARVRLAPHGGLAARRLVEGGEDGVEVRHGCGALLGTASALVRRGAASGAPRCRGRRSAPRGS